MYRMGECCRFKVIIQLLLLYYPMRWLIVLTIVFAVSLLMVGAAATNETAKTSSPEVTKTEAPATEAPKGAHTKEPEHTHNETVEEAEHDSTYKADADMDEHQKVLNYFVSAVAMVCVLISIFAAHKAHKDWLTESTLVVIAGIIVGGICFGIDELIEGDDRTYANSVRFDQETFITTLLPIIIFEAGYSLQHGGVMRQIGTVMAYAIPGTLLSTMIIGFVLWSAAALVSPELHEADGALFLCLTFGSLLSATDPVAVIAVLGAKYDLTKEPPLLYNLIFGESVLNDAVAIVLFNVFLDFIQHPITVANVFLALGKFSYIFVCSALLGYVFGCISAWFLKHVNLNDLPHVEIITLVVFAAASYYLSEYLHLSGIMSIFICARLMGIYSVHNMSEESNAHAQFLFKTAAMLAETYVFLFLGSAVWAYTHNWNFGMLGATLIIVLMSRAFVVFPISWFFNRRRKVEPITLKMQLFMWFAGLRGAIAFGLCVMLLEAAEKSHIKHLKDKDYHEIHVDVARMLLTTGLGIILFMVLIMGSLSGPLLKALDLHKAESRGKIEQELSSDPAYHAKKKHTLGKRAIIAINHFNDTKIRPFLQRNYVRDDDSIDQPMIEKDEVV